MNLKNYPHDDWVRKEDGGAVNVETRMLLIDRRTSLAKVRFQTRAVFPNKDSAWDCHVMCVDGAGYVEVGGENNSFRPGDAVLWPKGIDARLWTGAEEMTVLLLEHLHQLGQGHNE